MKVAVWEVGQAPPPREVPIDVDAVEHLPKGAVEQFLNEWVMLARSKALTARGKVFEARDEVMA